MFMKNYVAIDIGGTTIKYALITGDGAILQRGQRDTEAKSAGVEGILAKLVEIVDCYRSEAELAGVAIASPGIIDADAGIVRFAGPNFPGYSGTHLADIMKERTGMPVTVCNDVNAAGLGEMWLGAGRGQQSAFCMAVGTGIGGAIIEAGRIIGGASGCAGEVGFMPLFADGTLEETASTGALLRRLAEIRDVPEDSLTGEQVFQEAKDGIADAEEILDNIIERWARAIACVLHVTNPACVILGGAVMAQQDYIRPRLEAALSGYLLIPQIRDGVQLFFASLGNDASLVGALCYHLQRI